MSTVTLIGIDPGKHCFLLHAQDRHGHEAWRKKVTRAQLLVLLAGCPASTIAIFGPDVGSADSRRGARHNSFAAQGLTARSMRTGKGDVNNSVRTEIWTTGRAGYCTFPEGQATATVFIFLPGGARGALRRYVVNVKPIFTHAGHAFLLSASPACQ
ncbi:hypothetical protein [Burkholderia sp. BE17]|uniref:hypothetical protein n=1 Tax=Burkholderia sp. BE17 TaxID=2656644 RepID=UPI00128D6421|nr:hypothetical protein [Burkholderia sp. BE17]